jgi:L-lactate dehydrogenase complex protein LldF
VLNPLLHGVDAGPVERSLPYASTLCGRCFEVCPVRIDIPEILVHLRGQVVEAGHGPLLLSSGRGLPGPQDLVMGGAGWAFGGPRRLAAAQRGIGLAARIRGRRGSIGPLPIPGPAAAWSRARDLPPLPRESFRRWWSRSRARSQGKREKP